MNIVHVIESLEFGGAEKVVIQLAERCAQTDSIVICTTKRVGELSATVSSSVKQYHINGREGNDLSVIFKLRDVFKHHKADIVHIHNWGVYVESVIAAKLASVKGVIITIHGPYRHYSNTSGNRLKKYVRHTVEKILSYFVDCFVAVSDAVKQYVTDDIGINSNKIHIIRNGARAVSSNQKMESTDNILHLVSIGRIATVKNHRFMLDGLKQANNISELKLTIVGDGPELENIKQYARDLGLMDTIEFTGFRTDIENILCNKDVFIMTSNYEGISIAMLEAMRVGIPVIGTRVGGIPETVIDGVTGILINQGDVLSLTAAIDFMQNNAVARLSMGTQSYKHFMAEFNEDAVIEKYIHLYKNTLK